MENLIALFQNAWNGLSTFVLSKIVCIPFVRRPFQKLNDPSYYGVTNAINLCIPVEPGQEIGAWFIRPNREDVIGAYERWTRISSKLSTSCNILGGKLPHSANHTCKDVSNEHKICSAVSDPSEIYLTEPDETVILYLHGNAETRSFGHRRELYKKLQALGIVVLAPDYRGYADSYGGFMFRISESTMAHDGQMSFQLLKKYIHPSSKVIVWGHSLGTGVTTKLANEVREACARPDGYVLEAPFNKMKDEVGTFLMAKGVKVCLDVDKIIEKSDLTFDSEHFIQHIKEPVFIMHAKDDKIIPYELGRQLYHVAMNSSCKVKFFSFEKNLHLGHDYIYKAEFFGDVVKEVVSSVKE